MSSSRKSRNNGYWAGQIDTKLAQLIKDVNAIQRSLESLKLWRAKVMSLAGIVALLISAAFKWVP